MNFKRWILIFFLNVAHVKHCVFLRVSGMEFHTVGPKTQKDFFLKCVKRKARNCQRSVKTAQRPGATVWMKKVRHILFHTTLIDALKAETSIFVLNLILHWKPLDCSEQCCCTCMPGLREDDFVCVDSYSVWELT